MKTLKDKILESFPGRVVRKDLAFLVKGGLPVPTYVLEYLLAQYCATDDPAAIADGIEQVKEVIRENYVHRADAESVKGKIRERGKYRVIDKITVSLNEKADAYHAVFSNLGLTGVPIGAEYVKKNPKLLSGTGVWCIVQIGYLSGESLPVRWDIQNLKPIQISGVDVEEYVSQRKNFSTEEWLDFLMHTVGLNPDLLNRREKLIILARLLPHVENNFNFIELGPKGTGKTHVFQELSPYSVLVSGGDVTPARLFVKMSGNKELLGLVGYWDVVAMDEFEQQKGRNVDAALVDIMQNYLANKSFNRGKATHEASASMVFVGNTKHTVSYMLRQSHLFESIPEGFLKGAFLDRIHFYAPGWEVPVLKTESFSKGFGLISDYVAAMFHELRDRDWTDILGRYAQFDTSLSERDNLAVRKTVSGMMKLLYPDGEATDEEVYELIDFAAEARKRVKDQLYRVDETFKAEPAVFRYDALRTGKQVAIETLENINNATEDSIEEASPLDAIPMDTVGDSRIQEGGAVGARGFSKPPVLKEQTLSIRQGQTGLSYAKLFAPYLETAHAIVLEDPYVRTRGQVKHFIEFAAMLVQTRPVDELQLKLVTFEEPGKRDDLIALLKTVQANLSEYGIVFSYEFRDFHDRCIRTDTGWVITLGRGLDIFDRYEYNSIEGMFQEKRKCRDFKLTYMRDINAHEVK